MNSQHVHRPSFLGFMSSGKTTRVKGRRINLYRCRECGATLRIVPSQREFHAFLPAIPIILNLFAYLILIYFDAKTLRGWPIALGVLIPAYFVVYLLAYRFTIFEKAPAREKSVPGK